MRSLTIKKLFEYAHEADLKIKPKNFQKALMIVDNFIINTQGLLKGSEKEFAMAILRILVSEEAEDSVNSLKFCTFLASRDSLTKVKLASSEILVHSKVDLDFNGCMLPITLVLGCLNALGLHEVSGRSIKHLCYCINNIYIRNPTKLDLSSLIFGSIEIVFNIKIQTKASLKLNKYFSDKYQCELNLSPIIEDEQQLRFRQEVRNFIEISSLDSKFESR